MGCIQERRVRTLNDAHIKFECHGDTRTVQAIMKIPSEKNREMALLQASDVDDKR